MDLLPSPDQLTIAEAAADVLLKELPVSAIMERRGEDSAISERAWRSCAETGLVGLGLPESAGGAGCGLPEETLLFREIGRQLAPGPFLATVLAGHVAWACGDAGLAAGFASGEMMAGLADPDMGVAADDPCLDGLVHVRDWAGAQWLVTVTEAGAGLVEAPALGAVRGVRSIDPGVRTGTVVATAVPFARWAPARESATFLRGLVLVAAQLVGIAEACRDSSVHYALTREQFGRPIGVNQAIKHACADMAVAAERASAQLLFAAASWDSGRLDAEFQARTAKVVASTAARENAAGNVQVHGGMGVTAEFTAHLFVERAEVLEQTLATRAENLAAIISLPPPQ
jgi:alkylation response protein AidB-like acyl-CoA dehydrogenase